MDLRVLFLMFIIYSIIGWIIEVINNCIVRKKVVNRGFLIGPYCPIYGFGAIIMTNLIDSSNDIISTFLKAMAICSILEYATSYIMEKLFKTRWWDYTNNKFNINGRICLETMILFGLGGVLAVEFISPKLLNTLGGIPNFALTIISTICFIIIITDVIVSYNIISSFKKIPKNIRKDSTDDITFMVRQTLKQKSYLYKRLVNSFPDFKTIIKKCDKMLEKQRKKILRKKKKLDNKINKVEKKLHKLQKQKNNIK